VKKFWWLILLAILFLAGSGWWFLGRRKAGTGEATPTPTPEGVLIATVLEERPHVSLTPRSDGREFTLAIENIKNAATVEYELVYLSEGLSRGVIGDVKVASDQTKLSRKLLLGTCSKNVCKYDKNITEGALTLRFRSPEGVRKFVADFHFQQGDDELSSTDGKFSLKANLSAATYYITMNTIGLPAPLEGEPASEIYGVFSSGSTSVRAGKVTIETDQASEVYAYDGRQWEPVTAAISSLATFVAVLSE